MKAILFNSKSIFIHSWYNAGVTEIEDLLNDNGHSFLAFDEINRSFNIRTHFSISILFFNQCIRMDGKKQLRLNDIS